MLAASCGSLAVLRELYQLAPQVLNEAAGQGYHKAWPLQLAASRSHAEVAAQLLDWVAVCCCYQQNQAQDESLYDAVSA